MTETGTARSRASASTAPAEPAVGQHGRMDPADDVADVAEGGAGRGRCLGEQRPCGRRVRLHQLLGEAEVSSAGPPAGPGRRRGGRARCASARRPSPRPARPGSRSAPATRSSSSWWLPRLSRRASSRLRSAISCGVANHHSTSVTTSSASSTTVSEIASPTVVDDDGPGELPPRHRVRGPGLQAAQRVLTRHRPALGRDGVPEGLGGQRAVPVGDPPQHRQAHEHDRDPHDQQRGRPARPR